MWSTLLGLSLLRVRYYYNLTELVCYVFQVYNIQCYDELSIYVFFLISQYTHHYVYLLLLCFYIQQIRQSITFHYLSLKKFYLSHKVFKHWLCYILQHNLSLKKSTSTTSEKLYHIHTENIVRHGSIRVRQLLLGRNWLWLKFYGFSGSEAIHYGNKLC